jgi:hypothetical protein
MKYGLFAQKECRQDAGLEMSEASNCYCCTITRVPILTLA